ncbi:MAG: zinc metalloprotease HtpX [Candidatus Moraniibacteriota bacterium]
MASLYHSQEKNRFLTWVYISIFLVLVIGVGYVFAGALGNRAILYIAVFFSVGTSFVSYWWSDKLVLKMSNAKPLLFNDNPEIYRLVENLAITAGIPMPKIYVTHDSALNAFATGRDPEHGVICLTTGIMTALDRSELEGVISHELSHIGNRDTLVSTIVVVLAGFVALLADWFRNMALFGGRDNENNSGQAIFFIAGLVLSVLAPLAALLIQLAVSRRREYLADASGALLTRYPEGLARALEKISRDTEPLEVANRATAHLYIANPLKGQAFANLFSTHPPIQERIARLREMEQGATSETVTR